MTAAVYLAACACPAIPIIARRRQAPGHIALVVLCELVWVLRGAYGYDQALVVDVLAQILATAELEVEDEAVASRALAAYRAGSADFADYVIVHANSAAGCEATYSFDRNLVAQEHALEP